MSVDFDAMAGQSTYVANGDALSWTHVVNGTNASVSVQLSKTATLMLGGSVSYLRAASLGTPVQGHNSSTAPTVTVSSATGRRVLAVIGHARTLSAPTQTQRYLQNRTDFQGNMLIEDAAGAASVVSSATVAGSSNWSSFGVDMIEGTSDPRIFVALWASKNGGGAATTYTRTVTCNGSALTSLGAYDIGASGGGWDDGFLEVFTGLVAAGAPPPTNAFFALF